MTSRGPFEARAVITEHYGSGEYGSRKHRGSRNTIDIAVRKSENQKLSQQEQTPNPKDTKDTLYRIKCPHPVPNCIDNANYLKCSGDYIFTTRTSVLTAF